MEDKNIASPRADRLSAKRPTDTPNFSRLSEQFRAKLKENDSSSQNPQDETVFIVDTRSTMLLPVDHGFQTARWQALSRFIMLWAENELAQNDKMNVSLIESRSGNLTVVETVPHLSTELLSAESRLKKSLSMNNINLISYLESIMLPYLDKYGADPKRRLCHLTTVFCLDTYL